MFAFRTSTASKEDFFLASRSLGLWVFPRTVFGANLTAFASQDVFAHYGGAKRFGENVQGWMGRAFVIVIAIATGEMKEFANVQIEVVLQSDAAQALLTRVESELFLRYGMIAFESDLRAMRSGKF